jgi:hypothetical protein
MFLFIVEYMLDLCLAYVYKVDAAQVRKVDKALAKRARTQAIIHQLAGKTDEGKA